jgi:hypothetical protein
MTLPVAVAEQILRRRFGEPAEPPTQYVIGFRTQTDRVLGLDLEANETRIWFQPPAPPELEGVAVITPSAKNSNLNGSLSPLNVADSLRVEVDGEAALSRFLDWYAGSLAAPRVSGTAAGIDPRAFYEAFARFQGLITAKSGHPFTVFNEGLAAVWEGYKPRLREYALGLLRPEEWSAGDIGSGSILNRMIEAIEIQEIRSNLTNNLVFWQNRFGHANRDHRVLLEAASNPKLRREMEGLLFGLFRGGAEESATFDRLSDLTGAKYPLLGYIYFLKDTDRFMPIQPTGFDRAFRALGTEFSTLRQCSWENYSAYNQTLAALRPLIEASAGLKNVRLIDAHSFCWIFSTLLKLESEGSIAKAVGKHSDGRIVGGWERSVIEIRTSILNTVKNSNGQIVERIVKDKQLLMDPSKLDDLIRSRLGLQQGKCNLTGITLHAHGPDADPDLLPSPDRIDSSRHYEADNIQIVCRFINFWKGSRDNGEFQRLLMLVRGVEQ